MTMPLRSAQGGSVDPETPDFSVSRRAWLGPWFLGDHCCADRPECNGYKQWLRQYQPEPGGVIGSNGAVFVCGPEVPA